MKRSKSQAVYRFLPGMWISEKDDSNIAITAEIKNWNYKRMDGIYESFIDGEIKHQIKLFAFRDGDTSSFNVDSERVSFVIVEPACNEGIPDIIGEISPLVFYCSSCGSVLQLRSAGDVDRYIWKCRKEGCRKPTVKQLQMIYACECGFAQAITVPWQYMNKELQYRPNSDNYKMTYREGQNVKTVDLFHMCPSCNTRLLPDNANSGRNYKPFILKMINLLDHRSGQFFEKGIEAHKAIITRWLGSMTKSNYEHILNNIELTFSPQSRSDEQRRIAESRVRQFIAMGWMSEENLEAAVAQMLQSNPECNGIDQYVREFDRQIQRKRNQSDAEFSEWVNNIAFKLMQYYTLKDSRTITVEEAIRRQVELEVIDTEDEVFVLQQKLGISNMQVVCDVQIVNCTYGFTRRISDPKNSNNRNCRLKLNAFDRTRDGTANLVYGAKLDTEGILFEISQRRIIEWLGANGIITEAQMPDLEDELSVKKWYLENVHSDAITTFGEVDESETITKSVFALLHSMSHAFIKTAGELSGLSGNSLTEIVFVETASIFIYAQSSQGIPLGALSGMAEFNYGYFLQKALDDTRNCIFDPICSERDHTACSACLIIPEISCNHFNSELGRKFLYSLPNEDRYQIGFWEMN